ncbi:hypothetical protein N7470_005091 [Penicillium chermesinum]|nr:hypothetical protein N7470_005091 [Penicillium chermesinum]
MDPNVRDLSGLGLKFLAPEEAYNDKAAEQRANPRAMSDFKVVIVGGSIGGLTLAKTLELYGIDYVLLEKSPEIGPQLGASVGIQPHASKILDQLGILEQVKSKAHPIYEDRIFGPDGKRLRAPHGINGLYYGLSGYPLMYLDLQQLQLVLYHSIEDQSKIHVNSDVDRIEQLDGFVRVITKSGESFRGDIVVGADGVYSQVREEMWRIADKETGGSHCVPLRNSITCSYKCIFGMSERPQGTPNNATFYTFHDQHSYFCISGPEGKIYWFAFFKNDKTTVDRDIPYYKADDAREQALKHVNEPLFNGLRFGDLITRQSTATMVPVEEFVLDTNFYKRAILIGDSFHKLNPLTGQGAACAIETATLLADHLKEALDEGATPNDDKIYSMFSQILAQQKPRTTKLLEKTKKLQRLHALENSVLRYIQLKLLHRLGPEHLSTLYVTRTTPGRKVKYLPETFRSGAALADEDVVANPSERRPSATKLWMGLMLLIALLGPGAKFTLRAQRASDPNESRVLQTYLIVLSIATNSIFVLESHRPGRWMTILLWSAIPYSMLSTYTFGWTFYAPLYFAIFIALSAVQEFYYPSPRAISPSTAAALPYALLVSYGPLMARALWTLLTKPEGDGISNGWDTNLSHLSFPFLVNGIGDMMMGDPLKISQLQFDFRDMDCLSQFYNVLFLAASAGHVMLISQFIPYITTVPIADLSLSLCAEWVEIGCLTLAVVAWSLFTVWDMQRVNLTQVSLLKAFLGAVVGSVLIGPAAVLTGLWWWRKYPLERGRNKPAQEVEPKPEQKPEVRA